MGIAKQCDRCSVFFDAEEGRMIAKRFFPRRADIKVLCPECLESFENWWNKPREEEE